MDESRHLILSEKERRDLDRYRELCRRGAVPEKLQEAFNLLGPNGRRLAKLRDKRHP